MTIERIHSKDLAIIIAGLVKEGVTFQAFPSPDGRWIIELTGGY